MKEGLRPFFPYLGSKWSYSRKYYPKPKCNLIIEPFAGSAGYSLRYPDRKVVLYDCYPVITGVWDYLLKATPHEILSLPDLGPEDHIDDFRLPQEVKWLIGFWLHRGNCYPAKTPSSWMRSGKCANSFWGERVRNTIASQLPDIKHWEIYNKSYLSITDNTEATWFVDPPYQVTTCSYKYGSKKLDYVNLGKWCRERKGLVIVCENTAADWLPFQFVDNIRSYRKNSFSAEAVWINNTTKGLCL